MGRILDGWTRDDPALRRLLLGADGVREVERAIARELAPAKDVGRREVGEVQPVAPLERRRP